MIRFATNNDINGIIRLWQEAFGDSPKEISFFLDNKFKPENTLVFEECGQIASMLFLLDGKMCIKGADYPAYYLYAACTAQKHRGKGLMSDLLKAAEKTAFERCVRFICLLPAEDSLYDYYARFGYQAVFSKKLLSVKRSEISDNNINFDFIPTQDLEKLRESALMHTDRFKWDNDAVSFAFEHTEMYSGYVFLSRKGYVLYSLVGGKIYVKEFTFAPSELTDISAFLFKKHDVDEAVFALPFNFESDIGKSTILKSGMLLPIDNEANHLINNIENAYLGLTLD